MRILLAEDEISMSRALTALLQKNNYSVDPVYDGDEALRFLRTGDYDAVVLDIMMPVTDGLTVLRTMRSRGDHTPVIMLTARSETDDKIEGLDSGANDYLTKPFDGKELIARIRAMTRSASVQTGTLLRFGDITLDQNTFDLKGPSGQIRMSGKEYQMLELMMSRSGTPIPTEKFMDKIWGIDSDADISVVWTFISYLRNKLKSVGSRVTVKAARGRGYYLEDNG